MSQLELGGPPSFSPGATPVQPLTVTNPTPAFGDHFGYSVGISGDHIVVGAREADAGAITDTGRAYVFNLASGTTLNFSGGTYSLASGASLSGSGSLSVTGATLNVASGAVTLPNLSITSGTLGGAGTATIPTFTQTGGSIAISSLSLNAAAPSRASLSRGRSSGGISRIFSDEGFSFFEFPFSRTTPNF